METKRCVSCKELKPIEEFGRSRQTKSGFGKHCLSCAQKKAEKKRAKKDLYNRFWECDVIAKPIGDFKWDAAEKLQKRRAEKRKEAESW